VASGFSAWIYISKSGGRDCGANVELFVVVVVATYFIREPKAWTTAVGGNKSS
jgi:hypothetical protein